MWGHVLFAMMPWTQLAQSWSKYPAATIFINFVYASGLFRRVIFAAPCVIRSSEHGPKWVSYLLESERQSLFQLSNCFLCAFFELGTWKAVSCHLGECGSKRLDCRSLYHQWTTAWTCLFWFIAMSHMKVCDTRTSGFGLPFAIFSNFCAAKRNWLRVHDGPNGSKDPLSTSDRVAPFSLERWHLLHFHWSFSHRRNCLAVEGIWRLIAWRISDFKHFRGRHVLDCTRIKHFCPGRRKMNKPMIKHLKFCNEPASIAQIVHTHVFLSLLKLPLYEIRCHGITNSGGFCKSAKKQQSHPNWNFVGRNLWDSHWQLIL